MWSVQTVLEFDSGFFLCFNKCNIFNYSLLFSSPCVSLTGSGCVRAAAATYTINSYYNDQCLHKHTHTHTRSSGQHTVLVNASATW